MKFRALSAALALAYLAGCSTSEPAQTNEPAAETAEQTSQKAPDPIGSLEWVNQTAIDGVYTAAQPSEAQFDEAAKAGVTTLINLRTPEEEGFMRNEAEIAIRSGMRYVHVPVAGKEGLTLSKARDLDAVLQSDENRPVLIHCSSGNRAGALLGLWAFKYKNLGRPEAVALAREAGATRLDTALSEKIESMSDSDQSGDIAVPNAVSDFLTLYNQGEFDEAKARWGEVVDWRLFKPDNQTLAPLEPITAEEAKSDLDAYAQRTRTPQVGEAYLDAWSALQTGLERADASLVVLRMTGPAAAKRDYPALFVLGIHERDDQPRIAYGQFMGELAEEAGRGNDVADLIEQAINNPQTTPDAEALP